MANASQTPATKPIRTKFGDDSLDAARKNLFSNASVLTVDQIKVVYEQLKKVLDDMTGQFLWPAVRDAHKARKVKEEHFVSALFVREGLTIPICKKSKNWDDLADPYDQLDLQAWCRYLQFGKDRKVGQNRTKATDQDAFFDFFGITLHYEYEKPITDSNGKTRREKITEEYKHRDFTSFCELLEKILNQRNLIAHENYVAGNLVELSDAVYAMHKVLSAMNYAKREEQRNGWQKNLLREFYDAIGEIDYSIDTIIAYLNEIGCSVPQGRELDLEKLLIEAGMTVADDKMGYTGNIVTFITRDLAEAWSLSQTKWNAGVDKIKQASRGVLPANEALNRKQKLRVAKVLTQYTYSMKDLLVKAAKEAHRAHGVNSKDFEDNLFIESGTGKLINNSWVDTRPLLNKNYRHNYTRDPYTWLDLQGWLKYLLLGGCRLDSNGNHVTDQDAVFSFLGIPVNYQQTKWSVRLEDSPIAKHLSDLVEVRNSIIQHDTPAAIEQTTTDTFVRWYEAISGLLTPMSKKQWNFQNEAIRLTENLKRDFFEAAAFAYSLKDIFAYIKYPEHLQKEAEQRLVELGFSVLDGKITVHEEPETFLATLPVALHMTQDFLRSPENEEAVAKLEKWMKTRGRANEAPVVRWFEKAAKAQPPMPAALYYLGCCALYGRGVEADQYEAMAMIRSAAKKGFAPAQVRMGQFCEGWKKQLQKPNEQDAWQWYKKAADQEHADGLYHLGRCYWQGIGVPDKDLHEAYNDFWDAEQQGHLAAKFARGEIYWKWKWGGLEYSEKKAETIYLELIEKDYVPAMLALADLYHQSRRGLYNPKKAKELYLKTIHHDEDNTTACKALANALMRGGFSDWIDLDDYVVMPGWYNKWITPETYVAQEEAEEAVRWLTQAAEKDDAEAAEWLADHYQYGVGTQKDEGIAVKWLMRAAELGSNTAKTRIAYCYDGGFGVREDESKARDWYVKGSDRHFSPAHIMSSIHRCKQSMTVMEKRPIGIIEDTLVFEDTEEYAYSLKDRMTAGQQGLWIMLNWIKAKKQNCELDPLYKWAYYEKTVQCYLLAQMYELVYAIQGSVDSRLEREIVQNFPEQLDGFEITGFPERVEDYEYIRVQEEDLKKVVELYQEAADSGLKKAMRALGRCYEQGIGADKDLSQAIAWYQKAADAGDGKAMLMLGDCYSNHSDALSEMMDAETAKQKAIEWYRSAYKAGEQDAWGKLRKLGASLKS